MAWEEAPPPSGVRRWLLPAIAGAVTIAAAGLVLFPRTDGSGGLSVGPSIVSPQSPVAADPTPLAPRSLGPIEVESQIAGDGALLDDAAELTIVAARRQALAFIDTATGATRDVRLPQSSLAAAGVSTMFASGSDLIVNHHGAVLRLSPENGDSLRVVDDRRAIPTFDDTSLWISDRLTAAVAATATRVAPDGSVLDHVHLPAVARPVAGTADGLVVSSPGGISMVSGGGARAIATGELIASDGERIARVDCDAAVDCLIVLGTIADPDQVRAQLADEQIPAGYYGLPTGAFSPDGQWLAFPLYRIDGAGTLEQPWIVIIDTATGAEVSRIRGAFTQISSVLPLAWSPDSQWLFVSSPDGITGWSATSGEAAPLALDIEPPRALAVLP
jgi:alkylhydroperoxidase family enzyme